MLDQLKHVLVERYIGAITIGLLVYEAVLVGGSSFVDVLATALKDIFIVNPFYQPNQWMDSLQMDLKFWNIAFLLDGIALLVPAILLYVWLYGGHGESILRETHESN